MSSDLKYWLALAQIKKIGPVRFMRLVEHFPSLEQAWKANLPQLTRAGIPDNLAEEIIVRRSSIEPDRMIEQLVKHRVQVVTINDDEYPKLLKHIPTPPPLLFFKGKLSEDKHPLAIVGTRKMSQYGKQVTQHITKELVKHKVCIVSGLALGVDATAHTSAVEHSGRTIAVLGSGLDTSSIYPSHNRYLADKIVSGGGCLFSEYPIGTTPLKSYFPQRNRIIAGMCSATLVVEAPTISGALITTKYALDFNRDVLAVPGNIFTPNAQGSNKLIRAGAHVVTKAEDILELLDIDIQTTDSTQTTQLHLTPDEKTIYNILSVESKDFQSLLTESKLTPDQLNAALTQLELKDTISKQSPDMYVKKN